MHISDTMRFIGENRDVLVTFLVALATVAKLTAWGRSQAAALDTVVGVIEALGARDVKSGVSEATSDLPSDVQDAISDSVAKADPKKSQPSLFVRIMREILRGV